MGTEVEVMKETETNQNNNIYMPNLLAKQIIGDVEITNDKKEDIISNNSLNKNNKNENNNEGNNINQNNIDIKIGNSFDENNAFKIFRTKDLPTIRKFYKNSANFLRRLNQTPKTAGSQYCF